MEKITATFACLSALVLAADAGPMRTEANSPVVREVALETEFVVCGGGLAGVCAAVAAARHGAKVVLVQDRPVLGGNASSEMRMGIVGAHGDQNYEAGILEEMQLENLYRNPLQRYNSAGTVPLCGRILRGQSPFAGGIS